MNDATLSRFAGALVFAGLFAALLSETTRPTGPGAAQAEVIAAAVVKDHEMRIALTRP